MRSFSLLCFFTHTPTTDIYTLSLHALFRSRGCLRRVARDHRAQSRDGLPAPVARPGRAAIGAARRHADRSRDKDRKSTRLNSSHGYISYAVFCLKKKKSPRHFYGTG